MERKEPEESPVFDQNTNSLNILKPGEWLIRESSIKGKLSLDVKKEDGNIVKILCTYSPQDGGWLIGDKEKSKPVDITKNNFIEHAQGFFEKIKEKTSKDVDTFVSKTKFQQSQKEEKLNTAQTQPSTTSFGFFLKDKGLNPVVALLASCTANDFSAAQDNAKSKFLNSCFRGTEFNGDYLLARVFNNLFAVITEAHGNNSGPNKDNILNAFSFLESIYKDDEKVRKRLNAIFTHSGIPKVSIERLEKNPNQLFSFLLVDAILDDSKLKKWSKDTMSDEQNKYGRETVVKNNKVLAEAIEASGKLDKTFKPHQ